MWESLIYNIVHPCQDRSNQFTYKMLFLYENLQSHQTESPVFLTLRDTFDSSEEGIWVETSLILTVSEHVT